MKKCLVLIGGLIFDGALFFCLLNPGWGQQQEIGKGKKAGDIAATTQAGSEASRKENQNRTGNSAEQTGGEMSSVEIPPEKQQLIGVKIVEASAKPLQKMIRAVGRIDYDERKLATVNTRIGAWVERLHVDYTGKYVKKGDPLVEIYSPELISAEQEYLFVQRCYNYKAVMRKERIETFFEAMDIQLCQSLLNDVEVALWQRKLKFLSWDITEEYLKQVFEKGEPIKTLTIYSPISGYVVQKPVIQGKRVEPGEKLFDIADLSTVYVIADVFAYELPLIKVGQQARISLSYFPEKEFLSKIELVYPSFSGETRTARVRFTIPNPGGELKPQMFTNVGITIDLGQRLTIPEDAVIDTGTRQMVYVAKGEGYFEPRQVELGVKAGGMVEVTQGLRAGEKVASSANFLIDSEAKLKGVIK